MPEWLQWVTSSGALAALAVAFGTYVRTRPAMKAAQIQGEAALWARITALEVKAESAADECEERIDRVTKRNEIEVAELKNEIRVLRHDRNNIQQALNAMFAMIKQMDNPELTKIVETVEEMIARGNQIIAVERASSPVGKGKIT